MDNRYSTCRNNYTFRSFADHSTGEKENFCFQKRGGKIDWKKIAAIDVDNFEHEYSINVLQDNIDNFVFCCIESEIDVKSVNPLFIKLFKVGQLIAEYLLHSQDHLITLIEKMQQKSPKPGNELKEKYGYNAENEHIPDGSKKTSNKDPVRDAVSCTFCYKVFESSKYVVRHIMRRHPQELAAGIKNTSNSNQPEHGTGSTTISQKEITDFMAKEINELKQSFDKSLDKIKCEIIEKSADSVVSNLKNQDKNMASSEINIMQFLDRWKIEEEEKHKAELGKIEREFSNKLHKLNLKVSNAENVIQNLEEKCLLSVHEVKSELFRVTEGATRELLDKYKTGFSEIVQELQTQLAESHEKCLAKLNHQDSQLREEIAEIRRENSIELQKFKVLLETTLSKMNGIESVHDLQQELKKYLELCYAKSQRRAQKKQGKLKSKSHSGRSTTQNVISKSSQALKAVAESATGNTSDMKLGSHIVNSESKKKIKLGKNLEVMNSRQTVADVHAQNRESVGHSRSLSSQSETKAGVMPIVVRPVVMEDSKENSEKRLGFQGQRGVQDCNEAKITTSSSNKVPRGSMNVVSASADKHKMKSQNSVVVGSWLQDENENGDVTENSSVMHTVQKFELQRRIKLDESDSTSLTSEEKVSYHVTKRLNVMLQESPDLVDGLRREVLDIVKDKMEKIGANDLYITDADFSEKMDLINYEKQSAAKKYPNYYDIRNWYNKYANETADVHEGGSRRRISFANPEVTAEVQRSSSEEVEELCSYPVESNSPVREFESSSPSKNDVHNSDGEESSSLARTQMCQSLPIGKSSVRKLPPRPESLGPYSCPKFLHSDLSSESSLESLGYPFKENLKSPSKKQECEELDEDSSTSGKELSSWDGDDLSSR